MAVRWLAVGALACLLASVAGNAWAQAASELSIADRAVLWVFDQQRLFHRSLAQAIRGLAHGGGLAAAWSLVAGSFAYGVFHAAGPGHGKAVLSAYLLTHRQRIARGVLLATAAALCQGVTAIVLVYGLMLLVGWLPSDASTAVTWSERLSYGVVAVIGGYLLLGALRSLRIRSRLFPFAAWHADAHGQHDHHDHDHEHGHCGHAHMPTGAQIDAATGLRAAVGVVLSVGLRPCSGAVLVLVLAQVLGLAWAGVGAVLAMSAGTAITVAALAFVAVNLRHWADHLIATLGGGSVVENVSTALKLAGGAVILWLGLSLLFASFGPGHPLGLG